MDKILRKSLFHECNKHEYIWRCRFQRYLYYSKSLRFQWTLKEFILTFFSRFFFIVFDVFIKIKWKRRFSVVKLKIRCVFFWAKLLLSLLYCPLHTDKRVYWTQTSWWTWFWAFNSFSAYFTGRNLICSYVWFSFAIDCQKQIMNTTFNRNASMKTFSMNVIANTIRRSETNRLSRVHRMWCCLYSTLKKKEMQIYFFSSNIEKHWMDNSF